MAGNRDRSANRLQGMSTIHHRGAAQSSHADPPKDVTVTSGQVAFDVEPATPHEHEAREIHSILQQCQGIIGAHEITPWRSQITVSTSHPPALLSYMPVLSPGCMAKQKYAWHGLPCTQTGCFPSLQVRSIVLGAIYGAVFSIIIHKLNLTTGVIPGFGMSIALIDFFTVKVWNRMLAKMRFGVLPFTPQVMQLSRWAA